MGPPIEVEFQSIIPAFCVLSKHPNRRHQRQAGSSFAGWRDVDDTLNHLGLLAAPSPACRTFLVRIGVSSSMVRRRGFCWVSVPDPAPASTPTHDNCRQICTDLCQEAHAIRLQNWTVVLLLVGLVGAAVLADAGLPSGAPVNAGVTRTMQPQPMARATSWWCRAIRSV